MPPPTVTPLPVSLYTCEPLPLKVMVPTDRLLISLVRVVSAIKLVLSNTRLSPACGTVPPQVLQLPAVLKLLLVAPVQLQLLAVAPTSGAKAMLSNDDSVITAADPMEISRLILFLFPFWF